MQFVEDINHGIGHKEEQKQENTIHKELNEFFDDLKYKVNK